MKRIWMNTEKVKSPPYFSIRWGLGQFDDTAAKVEGDRYGYCPKIFTTRTHPLSGEYYVVVEGSRYKAKPVEPEIKFKVTKVADLNLHGVISFPPGQEFDLSWKTFAENDLGVKGATFEQLVTELLRLNKKATLDTPCYINRLEAI